MESSNIIIPPDEIFKIYKLDSTGIARTVYIFGGSLKESNANLNELFSEIELAEFQLNDTQIIYSKQQIHKDDSIRILKKKIINEIGIDNISYNEMYLFSKTAEKIKPFIAYHEMTNNDQNRLDQNMFGQLLLNLNMDESIIESIVPKEIYTFDDLTKYIDSEKSYEIPISIGQRFSVNRNLLFSANPFDIIPSDPPIYKENINNPRIDFENQLILNNGVLVNKCIYLCTATDTFDYAIQNNIDEQYIAEVYFPLLSKIGILNKTELLENQQQLLKENKKIIKKDTMKLYKTVDLFYNMYYSRKSELQYLNKGITAFHVIIHPESKIVLPLDSIFKNIHSTIELPFIKYNAGSRKENIYRLYSEKISKTGKKIPYLSKNLIMNLSKQTGKNKQISLFTQKMSKSTMTNIYINFEYNGNISIRCDLKQPLSKEEVEQLLLDSINPIISSLNSYLEQTGYIINPFVSLSDSLLEIISLKYISTIIMNKKIDLEQQYGCLSSIFNIVEDNLSKGAILEFKRVENYQKMDSISSTITEAYNNNLNENAICELLMQKYSQSFEESSIQLAKYLNDHTRIQGKFANKAIDIAEKPGFATLFTVLPFENKFVIEMDNINNIEHIDILNIYIDSFLRMSQDPGSSGITTEKMKTICKKSVVIDDVPHISNVIGQNKPVLAQPIVFGKVTAFPGFDEEEEGFEFEDEGEEGEEGEEDNESIEFHSPIISKKDEEGEGFDFEEEEEEEKSATTSASKSPSILGSIIASVMGSPSNKKEEEEDEGFEFEDNSAESNITATPSENISAPSNKKEQEDEEEGFEFEENSAESNSSESASASPVVFGSIIPTKEKEDEDEEEGFEFEDEEEEDDEEEDDEDEYKGGNDYNDKRELFDNKPFKKSKIFFNKMKQRDPKLFLSKAEGNYDTYSRVCPTNVNLQPVLLTPEEKERIDKEFPGSYNKALKYGTDPENPNYYICPRYWCLLTNSSMTHEDVVAGKCGKIIPKVDSNNKPTTKIPPGHYVYEFTDDRYHKDENGNYREHFPGFKPSESHPDGLCIPCCYNNWNSEARKTRRNECLNPAAATGKESKKQEPATLQNNLYVMGIDKYPIPVNRWGFLPPSVESFFQIDHLKMVSKNNSALVNENMPILLRYGVEQSNKQSFIGSIADIFAFKKGIAIPSIADMRKIIAESITLDMYIKYHNGSLVSIFQPKKIYVDELNISNYSDTEFYKSIDTTNESQMDFLEDTIASFENFIQFMNDDNSVIDHTYLWDIIIHKNENLFHGGVNLVIIEIVNNDITDNIQILCPTNSYSKKFYDRSKETIILLKHDDFYEPIYLYENKTGHGIKVTKVFYKDITIKNIKHVLEIIQNSSNKYCTPLSSMPKVYKFEKSISLLKLREQIKDIDLFIHSQIMNYQGKIIGVIVKDTDISKVSVFVPCLPSASVDTTDLKLEFMENDIWTDYRTTRDFLKKIYNESAKKIPCKPVIKVIENNLIVGILTLTNQFVQINPPSENIEEDGLEILKNTNYLIADKVLTTSKKEDEKRIEVTKNIFLESQFYLAFRSTIRILMNVYANKDKRNLLLKIIDSPRYLYKEKLAKIEAVLRVISNKSITFQEFDKDILFSLHEISTCTSDCDKKKYCIMKQNGKCNLIVPQKHLVSGVDNNMVYYARMADELLRYKRVRVFMFESKTYLNITNIEYKLNNNEFIILQSLLTNEYFNDLIPFQMSNYVKNITYELSKPDITQKYPDVISLADQKGSIEKESDELSIQCINKVADIYGNNMNIWKKRFPKKKDGKDLKEIYFNTSNNCSFYVVIQILQTKINKSLDITTGFSISNLKETLLSAYSPYIKKYSAKLFDILKKQGKKNIIQKVEREVVQFETVLMSEEYYLTDLDIWLLATKLNLPIIIFSLDDFKTMIDGINWLVLGGDIDKDDYFFIRSPKAMKVNESPHYSLINTPLKLYELKGLDGIIQNMASGSSEYSKHFVHFDTFIRKYVLE